MYIYIEEDALKLVFLLPCLDANKKDRRFHRLKHQWGFDQLIPIRTFNDVSNGYLLDDTCVFGAEVFVTKEMNSGKGECLSMIKDAISSKNVWKMENFSKLNSEYYESQEFFAGDQKWYPLTRYFFLPYSRLIFQRFKFYFQDRKSVV